MKSGVKVLFWPESGFCDKENNTVFYVSIYIHFPKPLSVCSRWHTIRRPPGIENNLFTEILGRNLTAHMHTHTHTPLISYCGSEFKEH